MMKSLSKTHHELIELCYCKGYTHEQIARIQTLPLGTVKTRIRKAPGLVKRYWTLENSPVERLTA
jgi:RNA polymerase sigma-70 factor (ECF subfamily)